MDAEALYQEGLALEREAERQEGDRTLDFQTRCQRGAMCRRQAADYWKQAAEQGHAQARYKLGMWYAHDSQKENGANRAFFWLMKAAEAGLPEAQMEVASRYAAGTGVLPDRKWSAFWYTQAAEAGHAGAAVLLGERCRKRKSWKKAVYWFTKAAEQGAGGAMLALADLYEQGLGVEADSRRAAEYARASARAGNCRAEDWLRSRGLPL